MAKETANNGNGWICLHRAFKDWQHYGEPSVMVVFIDLLLSVNAKDGWWHGHKCERGATFRSIRSIAEDTTLNPITIRRAFAKLETTGEIKRIKIDQKHTKTIVCNFAKYQDFGGVCVLKSNTQSNTQSNTKQQYNKDNNIKRENNNTRAHEEILQDWLNNRITLERFCMAEHLTIGQFTQLAQAVINEWAMTGESGTTESDTRKKMLAHIRRKAQAMNDRGLFVGAEPKDKRLKGIIEDCKMLIAEGYNVDSVREFFAYWTQPANDSTGRMLFEKQSAWDTRTRYIKNLNRKAQ